LFNQKTSKFSRNNTYTVPLAVVGSVAMAVQSTLARTRMELGTLAPALGTLAPELGTLAPELGKLAPLLELDTLALGISPCSHYLFLYLYLFAVFFGAFGLFFARLPFSETDKCNT
jgi:hypothetical protein